MFAIFKITKPTNIIAIVGLVFSQMLLAGDLKAPFDFENTLVLPANVRNPRFKDLIMFVDERIGGDGTVSPLGNRLNKPVTWKDVVDAQDDSTQKAVLQGYLASKGISGDGTAGATNGVVNTYANIKVPVLAWGITSRFTLAVAVPVYHVEVNADTGFGISQDGQKFLDSLPDPVKRREAEIKFNNAVNRKLARLGYESIQSTTVNNIGDVSFVGKYRLFEVTHGLSADSVSLKGTLVAPTGVAPNANKALDVPTGDGQWDVGLMAIYDHRFSENLKMSAFGGYTAQLKSRMEKRIPVSNDEILSADKEVLDRKLGDMMTAGVSTQYQFDMGLALAAGYAIQHQNAADYGGTAFDPSRYRILEFDTMQQLQTVSVGIGFNGVELYQRHKLPVPFQFNTVFSHPVTGINVTKNDLIAVEASLFF